MEIQGNNNTLIESRLAQRSGRQAPVTAPSPSSAARSSTDIIQVSRDLIVHSATQNANTGQTRLVKDTTETIDKGFRRTQSFERTDGRTFTRIEEFTVSDRNARRTVIQQNASGNTTRLDAVFERQDDGSFRHTRRYTDESGDTTTQIETGIDVIDPFILSGGRLPPTPRTQPPFNGTYNLRGTQLDLQV